MVFIIGKNKKRTVFRQSSTNPEIIQFQSNSDFAFLHSNVIRSEILNLEVKEFKFRKLNVLFDLLRHYGYYFSGEKSAKYRKFVVSLHRKT